MNRLGKLSIGLSILIALVQIFDIVIHVATDQAEPLRIASNIIILAWLAHVVSRTFVKWAPYVTAAGIGGYGLLNGVFLASEGVVNSESGEFRMMMVVLLSLTTGLSAIMARRYLSEVRNGGSKEL